MDSNTPKPKSNLMEVIFELTTSLIGAFVFLILIGKNEEPPKKNPKKFY
jgi:hypothetical protein